MEYLRRHGTYIEKPRWVFETFTICGEEEITYQARFGDFDPPDYDVLDYLLYRFGIRKEKDGTRVSVVFTSDPSAMVDNKSHRYTAEKIFPSDTWKVIRDEVIG